jgi:hypothetical protein
MPKSAPRARQRRPRSKTHTQTNPKAVATPAGGGNALDRIARGPDAAQLARAVPHLAPEMLHALVRHQGLDAAGDLVAAATPAQLTAVFDIDLWRPSPSGRDERFDADRFGEWVEALVESDERLAARTIAALGEDLVITGLSRYVRVFDPAAIAIPMGDDEEIDFGLPSPSGPSREVGGYLVRARRTDAWDAIVTLLFALAEHHPDRFHGVMHGCRRLSNSAPEIDGLDDLLVEPEQVLHDVAVERELRRSKQGYVAAADARAFLKMARSRNRQTGPSRPLNPIAVSHLRASEDNAQPDESNPERPDVSVQGGATEDREAVEAVVALLEDAGLMQGRPKALLPGAAAEPQRPMRMEALLRQIAATDEAAFAARTGELAFLANVLVAGGSIQARAFTPQEASEAAIAICNLGIEQWPVPDSFLAANDLVAPFEAGWAMLHELGLSVARQLVDVLAVLHCADADIHAELQSLRRELVRQCENGTPWRAQGALEVLAMLDMPVCVSLQALLGECPVFPDALTAILERRKGSISATAFEFISTDRQIQQVRDFAGTLLDALTR